MSRTRLSWAALGLLLGLACLVPALLNGLPLVFPDTQGYLPVARSLRPSHLRAFGYGAFLRGAGVFWSLWLPVIAQAAIASWLTLRLVALEAPGWPAARRLPIAAGIVALLCLGHMPWLAAWLMPDLFTGLLLLGLLLGALHWPRLAVWERALLLAFLPAAATLHLTHPPLLAGFALASAGLFAWTRLRGERAAAAVAGRAGAMAAGAALVAQLLLVGSNWVTYREPTGSTGGPVFLFARLQADLPAADILRPHCEPAGEAGARFAICGHLGALGMTADEFLWRPWSPLPQLGWMAGFWQEARQLNPILLRAAWPGWLRASAGRTGAQLLDFELGDGMDAEGPEMLARDLPRAEFGLPEIAEAVTHTRQAEDGLRPLMPHGLAEAIAAAGLLALAGLAAWGLRRGRPGVWLPAVLFLLAYLGHAALIALAGEVHGRYGARIVFLAPLLAVLVGLRARYGARYGTAEGGASTLSR